MAKPPATAQIALWLFVISAALLVPAGLEQCKQLGFGAVVLVGDPEFYSRFGFRPASRFHLTGEFEVPDEAWLALELAPGFLADAHGLIKYHPAFRDL